jgi:hypothetical protein
MGYNKSQVGDPTRDLLSSATSAAGGSSAESSKVAFGFKWAPRLTELNVSQYIVPEVGAGIYVLVRLAEDLTHRRNVEECFGDPNSIATPEVRTNRYPPARLYDVATPSDQLVGLVTPYKQILDNESALNRRLTLVQGYLEYANKCLNLINATETGRGLLAALVGTNKNVNIFPGHMGNQNSVLDFPTAVCAVTNEILVAGVGSGARTALQRLPVDEGADRYNALANAVNTMPLYSIFQTPQYRDTGFLTHAAAVKGPAALVTAEQIKSLFETTPKLLITERLQAQSEGEESTLVDGISLTQYKMNAIIATLYPYTDPSTGSSSFINFCIVDESSRPADRPPAVGLAHELIHAYYSAKGTQIGFQADDCSTTLYELLATGLEPFQSGTTYPYSDNRLRAEWSAVSSTSGVDSLNATLPAGQRTVYAPVTGSDQIIACRRGGVI